MKQKHSRAKRKTSDRNPLYIKIGKRIRQVRLMANETNTRVLSEKLGWSGGRLNNFETGASTPGVEETLQLCQVLSVNPCWITYGVGSPNVPSLGKPKEKFDESHMKHLPNDMRKLLELYSKLSESDRRKFYAMGELLLS